MIAIYRIFCKNISEIVVFDQKCCKDENGLETKKHHFSPDTKNDCIS